LIAALTNIRHVSVDVETHRSPDLTIDNDFLSSLFSIVSELGQSIHSDARISCLGNRIYAEDELLTLQHLRSLRSLELWEYRWWSRFSARSLADVIVESPNLEVLSINDTPLEIDDVLSLIPAASMPKQLRKLKLRSHREIPEMLRSSHVVQ